ncbi:MAG TPA: sigma-54 dependent transcriptional regulator [Devosia sp.]|nr:sigma-54 dependent transcriptional regulator [Devosia sp.]
MTAKTSVMIVEDEGIVRNALDQWLNLSGFAVTTVGSAREAMTRLGDAQPEVVISDVRMPSVSGLDLLAQIRDKDPTTSVILITAHGDVPMAVKAIRDGAYDFLQKPYEPEQLVSVIERAAEQARVRRELVNLRRRLDGGAAELSNRLIGSSPVMEDLRQLILDVAAIDTDVIILGETGTGKEVVARALHDFSPRSAAPFVAVNCAAIPAELIESELFGHEAGAFTGSAGPRIGKFEFANGGTLLLDEIESMPLLAQAKVLRVIQERTVERVGSNRQIPLDLRIIAATKVDLLDEAEAGRFRADLHYRLNTASIAVPPLRHRGEDALLLFHYFLELAQKRFNRPSQPLHPADIEALSRYAWPGNVRELKTVADKFALGLSSANYSIQSAIGIKPGTPDESLSLADRLAQYERSIIEAELRKHDNSIADTADALNVPRRTLSEKMTRLGVRR